VLGLDDLSVSESDLLKAIVRWGIAKFPKKEGEHVCTGSELREVIDPFIKLIRFMSMECKEFAELCISPNLLNVLSADEQRLIFLSLVLKNHKYMPVNFNCSNVTRTMSQSAIICSVRYLYQNNLLTGEILQFSANQSVNLLGIAIDLNFESNVMSEQHVGFGGFGAVARKSPPGIENYLTDMKFTVLDALGSIISEGNTSNVRNVNGNDIIVLSPTKTLQIGHGYTIKCTSSTSPNNVMFQIENLNHTELLHDQARTGAKISTGLIQRGAQARGSASSRELNKAPTFFFSVQEFAQPRQSGPIYDSGSKSQQAPTNQRNVLQINLNYSRAPITGFIFDPLVDS
jgi:hypothetical protein